MKDMDVQNHGTWVTVSQETLEDGLALAEGFDRWMNATPQERLEMARNAEAKRREERRAAGDPVPFTLDGLLDKLGFSREYAEHLVQPYCYCADSYDGWQRCEHARDLDLE